MYGKSIWPEIKRLILVDMSDGKKMPMYESDRTGKDRERISKAGFNSRD
jgi:hypothetical protein